MRFRVLNKLIPDNHTLRKLFHILNQRDRFKFVLILVLSLVTGFVQSLSVASFMPFMNLLLDIENIFKNAYLNQAYEILKFENANQFVIAIGLGVASLVLLGNALAIFTSWIKNRFTLFTAHNLSTRLLSNYLAKPYEFILNKNTSDLGKNVLNDVFEVTNGLLNGILDLIINVVMIVFILALLLAVNVQTTLVIISFFILSYGSLIAFTRKKLRSTGDKAIITNIDKYKYTNEALSSFKISKALGIEPYLIERFSKVSKKNAKYKLFAKTLQEIPRYVMDALIFSGMAGFIVFLIIQGRDIKNTIPIISVYALAGYRIMPELAKAFGSLSSITHNRPMLDRLYSEITTTQAKEFTQKNKETTEKTESLEFTHSIELRDVKFNYENSEKIINGITIDIPKGSVIGFAGTTGAGKTTLIDILLGLLKPQSGGLYIDGHLVDVSNVRQWQSLIGYVPQEIYLIDDTIRSNIAFGIPKEEIDQTQVEKAARIASIHQFITSELPKAYDSDVGERGVRLSGGQRQRIGLARALYRNPQVLILDEATSALDGATESSVIRGIHEQSNVKTIVIIAHRLNTLKSCDQIYLLEHGRIVAQGDYSSLSQTNEYFKKMAKVEEKIG